MKMTIILIAVVSIGLGFLPTVIKDNSTLTISAMSFFMLRLHKLEHFSGFAGQISSHSHFGRRPGHRLLWFAVGRFRALFLGGLLLCSRFNWLSSLKLKGAYFTPAHLPSAKFYL